MLLQSLLRFDGIPSLCYFFFQLLIAPYTFDISIGLMLMSSCPDSCVPLKSGTEAAEIEIG